MKKDKTLERIIRKVAVDLSVSEKTVEDAVSHMFSETRRHLASPEMPSVLLHRFGRFEVELGRINAILRNSFNMYRKGVIDRERMVEIVEKLWKIRRRLQIEQK